MDATASALNRVADAIFALNGTIGIIGFLFLFFKNMGGKDKIVIEQKPKEDGK